MIGVAGRESMMRAWIVALAVALSPLGGCFSTYKTSAVRTPPTATLATDAWPTEDLGPVEALRDKTPEFPNSFVLAPGISRESLSDKMAHVLDSHPYTVTHNRIHRGGLLRVWTSPEIRRPAEVGSLQALMGDFEPNAGFLSPRALTDPWLIGWRRDNPDTPPFRFLPFDAERRGEPKQLVMGPTTDEVFLTDGIDIEFPPAQDRASRGLVLHILALISNQYEADAVEELHKRGWAVITIDSDTSARGLISPADHERLADLEAKEKVLRDQVRDFYSRQFDGHWANDQEHRLAQKEANGRMRESSTLGLEISRLRKGKFECCDVGDAERVGTDVAAEIDRVLADQANAAAAVLEYIHDHRPDLPTSPLVIVGFSAGALATPAIAARLTEEGHTPDAIVLFGAGADLLEISHTTSMKGSALPIVCQDGPVPEPIWNALHDSYVRHTRLDPLKTAPLLTGIPVLQVHAQRDTIVPASTGKRLWTLLGEPDRIDYFLGHEAMFYHLGRVKEWMADWVEFKVPTPMGWTPGVVPQPAGTAVPLAGPPS